MFKQKDLVLAPFYWNSYRPLPGRRLAYVTEVDSEGTWLVVTWLDTEILDWLVENKYDSTTASFSNYDRLDQLVLAEGRTYLEDDPKQILKDISEAVTQALEEDQDHPLLLEEVNDGHAVARPARERGAPVPLPRGMEINWGAMAGDGAQLNQIAQMQNAYVGMWQRAQEVQAYAAVQDLAAEGAAIGGAEFGVPQRNYAGLEQRVQAYAADVAVAEEE